MLKRIGTAQSAQITTLEHDYPYKYYPTAMRWFYRTVTVGPVAIYQEVDEKEESQ